MHASRHTPTLVTRSRVAFSRRALSLIATAALLVGATACGDDDDDGPTGVGVAGTYNIVSVTGISGAADNEAPFVIFNDDIEGVAVRVEIVSGYITLDANGTYTADSHVRTFANNIQVGDVPLGDPETGAWTQSGNTITLAPSDDTETYFATVSGNTLTSTQAVDVTGDDVEDGNLTITAQK